MIVGLIVAARLLGLLEGLELRSLDRLLLWRPPEPTDDHLLIVGIDETDIQALGTYPLPDQMLADLVNRLAEHQPRAIGLDLFRDLPVEPGHQALIQTLTAQPQAIGSERILTHPPVAPPPFLPPEQVGFVDFPLDGDGFVRRSLLATYSPSGSYHFSLALHLASRYLEGEGLPLTNSETHPLALRFGDREILPIGPYTGGYVRGDMGDQEILLNPRSGRQAFRRVSLGEVMAGQVNPAWIRDRVVLVGITASSVKDLINSGAIASPTPGIVYGVEMQAQATSQIIQAAIAGRPLLRAWPETWEYLWILTWGGRTLVLVGWLRTPGRILLGVGLGALALGGISYGLLWLGGWWLPLVPALLALGVNGLLLPGFYLYDQMLRSQLQEEQRLGEERQRVIEHTYNAIHNGPLQTLALLLRQPEDDPSWQQVRPQLQHINQDLRHIYETLLAAPAPSTPLTSRPQGADSTVPNPLHETLQSLYLETLERNFPGFQSLQLRVVSFQDLDVRGLSPQDLQDLQYFFQEALLNVGKHGLGTTRLTINCQTTDQENLLQVMDNAPQPAHPPPPSSSGGRGTRQARALANRLGGQFHRFSLHPGTCCELRWPRSQP
jgi:CHASE2 domain-containing sensor protein